MGKIRPYQSADWPAVLSLWNQTAENRWVYYPLTEEKFRWLFAERPDFSPENFLVAEDTLGVAGGIIFRLQPQGKAELLAFFVRDGQFSHPAMSLLMAECLEILRKKNATILATTSLSHPAASDTALLEFFWSHRFFIPAVNDPLIDQKIASLGTWMSRDLADFSVPEEILAREKKLEVAGFSFPVFSDNKHLLADKEFDVFPFSGIFQKVVKLNSPREHFFPAVWRNRIVAGVMVSEPGAATDWRNYGCDCGLFGPAGVRRDLRGTGLGTVLLFKSIHFLKKLGYQQALIPTNPTTVPFYQRAGFRISRVTVLMERPVGQVKVKFKEVP
ncbi:MAG: GNAT family N-acetyltransferase [Candidatus Omnitrophica bacterium]|nr:GNAT family N-acetyltransferase [Candidatus Omnitrophota bacterium]